MIVNYSLIWNNLNIKSDLNLNLQRKNTKEQKQMNVGEGSDVYDLRFIKGGKQIFAISYDNIGYPERAILLMNELMKENQEELR